MALDEALVIYFCNVFPNRYSASQKMEGWKRGPGRVLVLWYSSDKLEFNCKQGRINVFSYLRGYIKPFSGIGSLNKTH